MNTMSKLAFVNENEFHVGVKNVWITEKFNLEQTLGPFLLIRLTRDA